MRWPLARVQTGTSNKMADEDGGLKENPFSFKKFVEKKSDKSQGSQNRNKKQNRTKKAKNPDIFEDESPFPDVATVKHNNRGKDLSKLALCRHD